METNKAFKTTWKHVICCLILLIIFVFTVGIHTKAEGLAGDMFAAANASDTIPLKTISNNFELTVLSSMENEVELAGPKEEVTVSVRDIDYYITEYADEIKFFAATFGVNYEDIVADLRNKYDYSEMEFESTNIGYLLNEDGSLKTFDSVERGIVEYFYNYVKNNPKKVNKKRVPYTGNAEYVENLIIYYTTHIYTNVPTEVALSIGAAESGYYKVKYMLRCNNVYGGMSSSGLVKYRNIEYGVLSYIRLLSTKYYGKGLDTIPKIGRVYCPVFDNFGNKVASPHWINLVNTAIKKYHKYNYEITMRDLLPEEAIA